MHKVEWIKGMAISVLSDTNSYISPDELDMLLSAADSELEKELYIELYNFLLKKKSEEVIKSGRF